MENFRKFSDTLSTQNWTTEDLLKSQTVGLVNLSDFRKRRAEVLEQKERESQNGSESRKYVVTISGSAVEHADNLSASKKRKRPKYMNAGKLSFPLEDENYVATSVYDPAHKFPLNTQSGKIPSVLESDSRGYEPQTRRAGPSTSIGIAPKALTKAALSKEAEMREKLRKDYLTLQENIKDTEFEIPFTFYDGTSIPGGICRMKKKDHVWLFLDRSRKVGAELGIGGGDKSKREWARVGVDDLMLVRGEIIIPHHFDFYYFIVNRIEGFNGPIFEYSTSLIPDTEDIEGSDDDPALTKVVDRRWYERNKHIFPASIWEEFDPSKDYTRDIRKDAQGNTIFLP